MFEQIREFFWRLKEKTKAFLNALRGKRTIIWGAFIGVALPLLEQLQTIDLYSMVDDPTKRAKVLVVIGVVTVLLRLATNTSAFSKE